jgi:two-component system response regulator NreC
MAKIHVLLAEDHTVVRQGLRRILEGDPDIEIVAEAGDGRTAIEAAQRLAPAIAIIDISLPGLNGIEVTRQLTKTLPNIKVLILSMHAEGEYIRHSLKAGARGYLLKDADEQDLLKAVTALNAGGSYFSPAVSNVVLAGYLQETHAPPDELAMLSDREREVLQLIAEGKSNKEVAGILNVAVSTAESHRKHVMEKLDLHNTAAVVRFAVHKGIVQ